MTDITNTHLEAALLDQHVAGAFHDKRYAFVHVPNPKGAGWQLGVAVANEQGYSPIAKVFKDEATAREWADSLNEHIGLSRHDAIEIICSTMRRTPRCVGSK